MAFLCATSYVWLTGEAGRAVDLVEAAWAPTDPRAAGRAIYFGDVVAPVGGPRSLGELLGRRVAYNDEVSLSGFHSLRLALAVAGVGLDRVDLVRSGSHLRSLELLVTGEVDAAAIDSNVWRRRSREIPELGEVLRPIAALGPHPVQPVVTRAGLSPGLREGIREALLTAHAVPAVAAALSSAELSRFVAVSDADYTTASCGQAWPTSASTEPTDLALGWPRRVRSSRTGSYLGAPELVPPCWATPARWQLSPGGL